jgi:hypothetical protein
MQIRIDDVSVNTDMAKLRLMVEAIRKRWKMATITLGVSPLVHDMSSAPGRLAERVFPKLNNAMSDFRVFYHVDKAGIPSLPDNCLIASHGLVHVDHRLLEPAAQEMSIWVSCSLLKARYFIPPFNKYNAHTERICGEHRIQLIKFEDGWQHMLYNKITNTASGYGEGKYYIHTHDVDIDQFYKMLA